ncbi:MAG: hypothetical protein ACLGHN_08290 [Bacteriovoracia bacterium]
MSLWGMFGRDPKDLFLEFSPVGSHWRVVTWNFDLDDPSKRRWTVEAHSEKEKLIIWEHHQNNEVTFFEGGRLVRKRRISSHTDELRTLMNLSIHSTLKYGLEANHPFMLTPVPGATTMDIQNESRALQWIQASFGTLSRAMERLKEDKSLILTAACFSGTVPDTQEEVLRVIAFNLDIFYYLKEDQSLQIVIFDDKDQGHGQSKGPTFQQIIKVTKPQFYDEISKLLHLMAQVGEIS